MTAQAPPAAQSQWITATKAWDGFVDIHPELGFKHGHWAFHNFLRHRRAALLAADAIRLARNRFWIAHTERFPTVAFDCATGQTAGLAKLNDQV